MTPRATDRPISNTIAFLCLQPNHKQLHAATSTRLMRAECCPKAMDGGGHTWSYAKIPSKQPCSILFSVGFIWLIFPSNSAQTDSQQPCGDQITSQLFPLQSTPNQTQGCVSVFKSSGFFIWEVTIQNQSGCFFCSILQVFIKSLSLNVPFGPQGLLHKGAIYPSSPRQKMRPLRSCIYL